MRGLDLYRAPFLRIDCGRKHSLPQELFNVWLRPGSVGTASAPYATRPVPAREAALDVVEHSLSVVPHPAFNAARRSRMVSRDATKRTQ